MYLWMVENYNTSEIKIFPSQESVTSFVAENEKYQWTPIVKIKVQEVEE